MIHSAQTSFLTLHAFKGRYFGNAFVNHTEGELSSSLLLMLIIFSLK